MWIFNTGNIYSIGAPQFIQTPDLDSPPALLALYTSLLLLLI